VPTSVITPPVPVSRRRLLVSGAGLALLGATACQGRPSTSGAWTPQQYHFYLADAPTPQRLLPLDPLSLTDLPATAAIALSAPWAAFSADGSTLVGIVPASKSGAGTIVVRRGADLIERARFPTPGTVLADLKLSRDGHTLVLTRAQQTARDGPQPDVWYVLDTASGRLRATVKATRATLWSGHFGAWINPAATRLYQPVVTFTTADPAPNPLQLVAYDLGGGAEAGRLTLPNVPVGAWRPGGTINGEPIIREDYPALTLNPAGDRLLIYQPDKGGVRGRLAPAAERCCTIGAARWPGVAGGRQRGRRTGESHGRRRWRKAAHPVLWRPPGRQ
jgi:hypothetical protein